MRIRDFTPAERPRERMVAHGIGALSDAELLAVLLGTGTREQNALDVGRTLLQQFGLRRIARLRASELARVSGIGTAKAARILAGIELGRRADAVRASVRITGERAAVRYCSALIGHLSQEHVLVLWLDKRHRIIGREIVTCGLVDESLLHAREVFRGAIAANASAVIIAHNHPSGDTTPSEADVHAAQELRAAGEVLGIPVLDQLVVTAQSGRSVTNTGLAQ